MPPMLGNAAASLGAGAVQRKLLQRRARTTGALQLKKTGGEVADPTDVAAGAGDKSDAKAGTDDEALKKEFDSFSVHRNVEGGFAGFKKIHKALIGTFGDIATANTYYKGVKSLPFLGRTPQVHTTLGAKLASAEKLLKQKHWLDVIIAENPSAGGFNVRENRNRPGALSDHSFGWAVDIEAALNPNVKKFPAAVARGLTGEGLFTGEATTKMAAGGTADELLPWAEKMRDASTNFRAAFDSEGTLKQAMLDYLTGSLGMKLKPEGLDMAMVKGAKEGKGGGKAGKKNFQDLVAVLAGADPDISKAQDEQDAEAMEAYVEKNGWSGWKKVKKQRDDARKARVEKMTAGVEAAAKKEHREATSDEWTAALAKLGEDVEHEVATKAARFLIEMYGIYKSSFDKDTKTGRKDASSVGTAGSVAANGFISLKPELIAALTGSDGGDLTWLGDTSGTKDFMHFQLKAGDRPALK